MRTKPVILHPRAVAQIEEARAWYAERSSVAAYAFDLALEQTLTLVRLAPHAGSRVGKTMRRQRLKGFPFWIIYRTEESCSWILALHHERRDGPDIVP